MNSIPSNTGGAFDAADFPTCDAEWATLLHVLELDRMEVGGRQAPTLSDEDCTAIKNFAKKKADLAGKKQILSLLANNSAALEFLAAMLKDELSHQRETNFQEN